MSDSIKENKWIINTKFSPYADGGREGVTIRDGTQGSLQYLGKILSSSGGKKTGVGFTVIL